MSSKNPILNAKTRDLHGRKVKQLRRQGLVPANVFGKKIKSSSIQLDLQEFSKLYQQAGETTLIDLVIDNKTNPVLISNVHANPVTGAYLHVDFHQVDLTEKVTANIPLEIVGTSPAVEDLGGILENTLTEIEVEALPANLPDKIEVNIDSLKTIGDTLSVSDLKIPSDVTLKSDPETPVVVISEPRTEVEEETPAEAEELPETQKPEAQADKDSTADTDKE